MNDRISIVAYAPSMRFLPRKMDAYATYLSKGPNHRRYFQNGELVGGGMGRWDKAPFSELL